MSGRMTQETIMTNEKDAETHMDQLSQMMKNATESLQNFCQEYGVQPEEWFNTRNSDFLKPQESCEPQNRISGDQVRRPPP